MKTIIAGSRAITDCGLLAHVLRHRVYWTITTVVSGGAKGVDAMGEQWARRHQIPLVIMPADWTMYGRSAGYKRNQQMAAVSDALVALWDGKSRGTKHMIDIAKDKGLCVLVHRTDQS